MKARVQKWGNSLALRIPKPLAAEMGLGEDSAIEMAVVDGRLIVEPAAPTAPTLDELLAGVTDENRHREVDTGAAVGNEAW